MKRSLWKTLAVLGVLFLILLGTTGCESSATAHYTRVDNAEMREIHARDNMRYEYQLVAYDEKGAGETVTFKTSRELRQNAYLRLWIVPLRGVVRWEEVQRTDLPAAVAAFLVR